jgi:multidrug efflux system outer membrane protein
LPALPLLTTRVWSKNMNTIERSLAAAEAATYPAFRSVFLVPALLASLLVLAGCSVAPSYQRPDVATPAAFKEASSAIVKEVAPATKDAPSVAGNWKPAQPAEEIARGEWWKIFNDETLNKLELEALQANQDLKAAAARLGQARALEKSARAGLFPQVGVGFGPTRQLPSPASQGLPPNADTDPFTIWRGQATIAYEADLFGRVSTVANAARFDAEKNAALFQSTLLALQSDVAQAYFLIRELDAAQALYADTVKLRQETQNLFQRRYDAGDVSELDLARAKTELSAAQSQSLGIARQRAVAEHALAILLGKAPAEFSFPQQPLGRLIVSVPAGLPSELLERRPDIAAAERAMAAANERIGSAKSAYFPRLALTGALGYESNDLNNLFKSASQAFVFGPLIGGMLTLPVFDGGARSAGVDRANSAWEEEVANYRGTVLRAFKEVEDNLANLRILDEQNKAQDAAVSSSNRAARISRVQYREGAVSYLSVIDADRSALQQQLVAVSLDGERARSVVNLIRAIGGGWEANQHANTASTQTPAANKVATNP